MTKEAYEEIKEALSTVKESDFDGFVFENKSWSLLRYLSHHRANVISWLSIQKSAHVLEVGGECGTITKYLAERVAGVDTVIPDDYERELAGERLKNRDNVRIHKSLADGLSDNGYNLVMMIGTLPVAGSFLQQGMHEYAADDKYNEHEKDKKTEVFSESSSCLKLLKNAYNYLNDDGTLFIALPNKFGLKYFAGYTEDYTDMAYAGILGDSNKEGVNLWGKNSLTELVADAGFKNIEFYYPYPDYLFTEEIFSDKHLPKQGDLKINNRDFSGSHVKIFAEDRAWNEIIKEGMFPEFSNSYIVLAQK